MVVTIEQHQITPGQQSIGHDLIGGRGTIKHEIGFIGVENPCRMLLRILGRAFVDQ
ncbi:hypothetical protein D3C73_1496530 [compost metagenome]